MEHSLEERLEYFANILEEDENSCVDPLLPSEILLIESSEKILDLLAECFYGCGCSRALCEESEEEALGLFDKINALREEETENRTGAKYEPL